MKLKSSNSFSANKKHDFSDLDADNDRYKGVRICTIKRNFFLTEKT